MNNWLIETFVIIGFGNIAQAALPLIKSNWPCCKVIAIEKNINSTQKCIANKYSVELINEQINHQNYKKILSPLLKKHTIVINLATEVSSIDIIRISQSHEAFYLDTCIDPWAYQESHHSTTLVTNYQLREELRTYAKTTYGMTTAVAAHGANPGFVSILVKKAIELMRDQYMSHHRATPTTRAAWAQLASDLGIRVIQISERDTQVSSYKRKPNEFINTWSADGLVTECLQPAELGWGSHEKKLPPNAVIHAYGSNAAIYLDQPSYFTKVKSWSPNQLDFSAYLITHNEAISIADYFSLIAGKDVIYRPTCYYAYHPCDEAIDSMNLLESGTRSRIMSTYVIKDEIIAGIDELGVFLLSDKYPALWLGSNLSIGKARRMADHNNATSLQVTAAILAGVKWIEANPHRGLVESEEMDHEFIYDIAAPYWSPIVSEFIEWRPDQNSNSLQFEKFLS